MPNILGQIFGEGARGILAGANDILDTVITNKEEVMKAKLELQKVVDQNTQFMESQTTQREKQLLEDLSNARAMNIEAIHSGDKFIRRFLYWLALFIVAGCFGLFYLLITGEIPQDKENVAYTVLGMLGTALTSVLSFFYGSSRGSDAKSETIRQLSKNQGSGTSQ